jgi:hypothetical protein
MYWMDGVAFPTVQSAMQHVGWVTTKTTTTKTVCHPSHTTYPSIIIIELEEI